MNMKAGCILLVATLGAFYSSAEGYNVLGIFHTMSRSHTILGEALMKGLAAKGHNITMITAFPQKNLPANYREIHVTGIADVMKGRNLFDIQKMGVVEMMGTIYGVGLNLTDYTLNLDAIQKFIRSDEKFDVVVMEVFLNEAFLGFPKNFNAPLVGLSTFGASKLTNDMVGSPSPLSYVPNPFLRFTDKMTFLERLGNTLMSIFEEIAMPWSYLPRQEVLYKKHFPHLKESMYDLLRNVDFVLLNNHVTLSSPRPYVPNMVEIGGFHVKRKADPLPEDLKTFIESAEHGVVYFSLGSNLKSAQLPVEIRDGLLRTFSKLKQKVMWKWEDDKLPGKPDNVLISKWFPQDSILAHPNVRVFITHGGLLSTTEATFYGVPLIGIPIFGDQTLNMAKTEKAGFGIAVQYTNLTETSITWALNEILGNKKYAEKAKLTSQRFHDRQNNPLDTGIYWIEYVARHKGAPHLHSAGQELGFIRYHNLDVFGFLAFIVWFVYYFFKTLLNALFRRKPQEEKSDKNKKVKRN